MAKIFPFKGLRYNQEKIKDMSKVLAPPYDIISKDEREHYYQLSPYNVIRLILNKEEPGDNEAHNTYTRANEFFQKWQKDDILAKENEFSFYIYEQEFKNKRMTKVRCGLIGLFELSDFNAKKIYPHEKTFSAPKLDRQKLLATCRANFSPIFGLYYDQGPKTKELLNAGKIASKQIINAITEDKINHRVWQLKDKDLIHKIASQLKDKQIFIADGHHRYEAALNYRNHMRLQGGGHHGETEPYNFVMMYLANLEDEGITILPTHRLLRIQPSFKPMEIKQKIDAHFDIKPVKTIEEMLQQMARHAAKDNQYIFGLYYREKNSSQGEFDLLILKDAKTVDDVADPAKPKEYNKLNVTVLHTLIIDKILSPQDKISGVQGNTGYTHSEEEAVRMVDEGKYELALFLNPTRIEELKNIALAGGLMPQKSTYFYPKLETGLVINKL
jgi:uncharacterized protein (DUF1015 family)